jgi:hypothetical protein
MARDRDYPQASIDGATKTASPVTLTLYADLGRVRIVIPANTHEFNAGPERSTTVDFDELRAAIRHLEDQCAPPSGNEK